MKSRFVNLSMLGDPLNWITVLLWVVILGFLVQSYDPMLRSLYPSSSKGSSN